MKSNYEIVINKYEFSKSLNLKLLNFLKKFVPDIDYKKWKWEYFTSKRKSNIILANLNGEIVGHYACLNYKFIIFSKIVDGAKAEGSYVDYKIILKKYKKNDHKIFDKLIRKLLRNNNNNIIFGFPNKIASDKQINNGYKSLNIDITKYYFLNKINRKKIYKINNIILNIYTIYSKLF